MIARADCQLIGRWRIVEADLWDRDYLDLVEPAHLKIGRDGWAEFAFGALTAGGQIEYPRTTVFFRWNGFDEGDEISGEASVELGGDGTIDIELSFDNGDDASLTARRL
jgi:hypothetical protein